MAVTIVTFWNYLLYAGIVTLLQDMAKWDRNRSHYE